jgi:hypothetical protein
MVEVRRSSHRILVVTQDRIHQDIRAMIIPSHEECRRVLDELADEPALTEWERDFIASNEGHEFFSDAQKWVIAKFQEKYEV